MPVNSVQIRLCIVSEIFHPEDKGGMGRQAHALAERLIARGVHVDAVTRKTIAGSASRERVGLVDVTRLPPAGVLKGRGWAALLPVGWFSLRLLCWLLRRANFYDVLLVQGTKTMLIPVFMAGLASRSRRVLKIDAFADIGDEVDPGSLAKMGLSPRSPVVRLWSGLRNRLLRRADGIIAISQEIRAVLLSRGVPAARIHSIPNGIDFKLFQPASAALRAERRARLGLPAAGVLVIFTGRLSRGKGLPMLVEVWDSLMKRSARTSSAAGSEMHLLIVGSGRHSYDDCEAEIKAFVASHGLDSSVHFTGQVTNVTEYLQAADLFVLPSESEGFPLALIEAMGAAKPCIVTRVSGAAEVVRDRENGMLIPIGDPAALRDALQWLLADPDRWAEMGRLARKTVLEFCEIESVADRYLGLLRCLSGSSQVN
jgi:glycosyltransferase involved in cell wall biosynthesis